MKVGIFGGSFNPVHLGHVAIVREALKQELVDRIIIVPAYQNPLKAQVPGVPEKLRWQMLNRTFAEFDQVEISSFEIGQRTLSYTHKTLEHFQAELPDARLHLLMGSDSYCLFHKWSNPEKIFSLADILVFPRLDQGIAMPEKARSPIMTR